jgi:uncharacterized membrane protein YoaK (UPF0700 family)
LTNHDRRTIALAIALSALAGYVDALGFLSFGNFFVSFMSGNSTRLAVGLAAGDLRYAVLTCGVIALFVLGVVVGTLVGSRSLRRRPAVLTLVAALLASAACFHAFGLPRFGIAAMLLAMGAENAVFQRDGEVSIGLTYMTGTLVKLGQRLAAVLRREPQAAWAPYLMLWVGLVVGATLGGVAHAHVGLAGLWIGSVAALLLAWISRTLTSE